MATATQVTEQIAVSKLSKDLRLMAKRLTGQEARYLVDAYYIMQEDRKRETNQVRALGEGAEPNGVLRWLADSSAFLEKQLSKALGDYAASSPVGEWSLSIVGIGPIIAAGLLAHIDIEQCPTVGHIWRYAGLDPSVQWLGREKAAIMTKEIMGAEKSPTIEHFLAAASLTHRKSDNLYKLSLMGKTERTTPTKDSLQAALARRPWNASLKTLCWKVGESFVKVSNHEQDVYGKVYQRRKAFEWEKNLRGEYAEQALRDLESHKYGKDTQAIHWYRGDYSGADLTGDTIAPIAATDGKGIPMLSPAHIHARAKRYAVKLFLAHWHAVAYESHYNMPAPKPYILTQEGHVHFIAPPNWPMKA